MTALPSPVREIRRVGAITLLVALAQISLVALTVERVLDPGATTFEVIGILVGLGMATGACATAFGTPSRNPLKSRRFGVLGIVAGLGYCAVWLSMIGGGIRYDDLPRLALLVSCDVLFTVWLVAAARLASSNGLRAGIGWVAVLMTMRAIGELVLCIPVLMPSAGPGPNYAVVFIAVLVLFGWIVLALWEMALGIWLLRTRRARARGSFLP
jgi:hypothetical protein